MKNSFFNLKREKPLILGLLFFFSFLFIVVSVSAAPPVTSVQQITTGYQIIDSQQQILKQGESYQYNFFLHNISSGLLITNTTASCVHYIANSRGTVIFISPIQYLPDGHWGINIAAGNFSTSGIYSYGTKCNSSSLGGSTTGLWEVTNNGFGNDSNFTWILLLVGIGFIIFGLSIKNAPISILGSLAMSYTGLYIIRFGINGVKDNVYTWVVGLIILMVAIYILLKSSWEMVEDL